jgi:uncharacterized protein YdaU (DUF1376 family)
MKRDFPPGAGGGPAPEKKATIGDPTIPRKPLPWFRLFADNWLGDLLAMTSPERAAYILLILEAWRRGGLLPADVKQLARLGNTTLRIINSLFKLHSYLFEFSDDEAEIARAADRRSQARVAARKRWNPAVVKGGDADVSE